MGLKRGEARTQVCPVGLDIMGKSALQYTGLFPYSMTRNFRGMQIPVSSLATTALESRQRRKAGHILGATEKLAPGETPGGLFSNR